MSHARTARPRDGGRGGRGGGGGGGTPLVGGRDTRGGRLAAPLFPRALNQPCNKVLLGRLRRSVRVRSQHADRIQTELDSGERVISERLEHVRSAAIGYWIGAGSRDETDAKAGVSHFIEHLLFKGSSRYSALQIAEIFDELGGELNAATSREHTVVYARVPDNHVETALDVMGDMVFSPLFDELDSEREVVLEEIAMYEDTPQDLVHDLIGEAVFGSHALGRPVIGTAEVISTVSRRTIQGYHRALYTPGNIVVAGAGSIDHDRLVALVERSVERRAEAEAGKPRVRPLLVKPPKPGLRFQRKDTEQYHVCLGAPGVSRSDRRRFAASILDAILGGSGLLAPLPGDP